MNNKGQAMVEMAILSSITIVSILFFVRLGLTIYINIAFDEIIEQTHLCELQNKSNCQNQLTQKLSNIGLRHIQARLQKTNTTSSISITADSILGKKFEKESELSLELVISS